MRSWVLGGPRLLGSAAVQPCAHLQRGWPAAGSRSQGRSSPAAGGAGSRPCACTHGGAGGAVIVCGSVCQCVQGRRMGAHGSMAAGSHSHTGLLHCTRGGGCTPAKSRSNSRVAGHSLKGEGLACTGGGRCRCGEGGMPCSFDVFCGTSPPLCVWAATLQGCSAQQCGGVQAHQVLQAQRGHAPM